MKSSAWKTYRTRFLVKAKKLTSTLSFTDHLGRQHCGRRGDYLVESFDGVISIAPRQIFEDIYVAMSVHDDDAGFTLPNSNGGSRGKNVPVEQFRIEPLRIAKLNGPPIRNRIVNHLPADPDPVSRARRKSPQPVRPGSSRVNLM